MAQKLKLSGRRTILCSAQSGLIVMRVVALLVVVVAVAVLAACTGERRLTDMERFAYQAADSGDQEGLRRALGAGVSPNLYTSFRGYLIHHAVGTGREPLLRILIDAGADVNARSEASAGPLILAFLGAYCDSARILLEAGADPSEVYTAEMAMRASMDPGLYDKSAREIYFNTKQLLVAETWESDRSCWLEVEKFLEG
jgi:hypothetical protein